MSGTRIGPCWKRGDVSVNGVLGRKMKVSFSSKLGSGFEGEGWRSDGTVAKRSWGERVRGETSGMVGR